MYELDIHVCIISIFFFISGVLIYNFKMYNLISGYNTMPKEQKKKYDIEKLAKMMRNVLFVAPFLLLAGMFVFQYFEIYQYFMIVYYPIVIVGMVVFLFTRGNSKKMQSKE